MNRTLLRNQAEHTHGLYNCSPAGHQDRHTSPTWTVQVDRTRHGMAARGRKKSLLSRQIRPPYCTDRRLGRSFNNELPRRPYYASSQSASPAPALTVTRKVCGTCSRDWCQAAQTEHIPINHEWSRNHRQKIAIKDHFQRTDHVNTTAAFRIIQQR
jgi:hypothetical protein